MIEKMKTNYSACALCNSTWGNYYKTIEDTKLFFCCEVCACIYSEIVKKIKDTYNLELIDYLQIEGNTRERYFMAYSQKREFSGKITFSNGKILDFKSSEN